MFYAGVYTDEKSSSTDIVIMEKVLTSARKQYFIREMRSLPAGTPFEGVVGELSSIYEDKRYIKKKKVFSQSGRPPKDKWEKPLLVIHFSAEKAPLAENIREARIPIEAVITGDEETGNSGYYGANYHTHREEIVKKFALASDKKRIVYGPGAEALAERVTEGDGLFSESSDGSVTALALAVWHCETVRTVKRY